MARSLPTTVVTPRRRTARQHAQHRVALAAASRDEMRALAKQAVDRAGIADAADRQRVEDCLANAGASIRRSLRSPTDPSGKTMLPGRRLANKEDLQALVPLAPTRFQAGQWFGDWQLEELLGVGGFGEVWKARNPNLPGDPPVALKFITGQEARQRLSKHEAGVLGQVQKHGRIEQSSRSANRVDPARSADAAPLWGRLN